MLKKLIFLLVIVLVIIIIIGEKDFGNIELSGESAVLPQTEQLPVQQNPLSFSEKLEAGQPVTIVFLGDYVTSEDSLPDGNPNHVALMANWFDQKYEDQVTIVNAGMNANTVSHIKDRLASEVLVHEPDLVVISAGLNDALGDWKISVQEYEKDYAFITKEIIESGETEVLIRTSNPTLSVQENIKLLPYISANRKLAKEKDIHFFDFYQVMADEVHDKKIPQKDLMQNVYYPNTKGQAYLFGKFKEYLTTELIVQQ